MLVEVTEREARGIYSDRYVKEKSGHKFFLIKCLPFLLFALPVGLFLDTFSSITGWLAVAVVAILVSPPIYFSLRLISASSKYAKKQIEKQLEGVIK